MARQAMTKLASLKQSLATSSTISIHYQVAPGSASTVIFATYPENLAMALCPYLAKALGAAFG